MTRTSHSLQTAFGAAVVVVLLAITSHDAGRTAGAAGPIGGRSAGAGAVAPRATPDRTVRPRPSSHGIVFELRLPTWRASIGWLKSLPISPGLRIVVSLPDWHEAIDVVIDRT